MGGGISHESHEVGPPEANVMKKMLDAASAEDHSIATTADGAVWSWGAGGGGRLCHGDEQDQLLPKKGEALAGQRVVAVSAGADEDEMPDLVDPRDEEDIDMLKQPAPSFRPMSTRSRRSSRAAEASSELEQEINRERAERLTELMAMQKGTLSKESREKWGEPGTLLHMAREWVGEGGTTVPTGELRQASTGHRQLAELLMRYEKLDRMEVARVKLLEVLREPDVDGLQEKIVGPAHAAMVQAAVDDFVRTWHHACYCWGGLVHAIDPSSFGTWCDDHFELLVHLGSKVFFMAGFADLITSLEHYEVTVPAGATTMGEVLGSAEFLETVHGTESLVSYLYESSPVPVNGVVSFHVMRSVEGLLPKGALFGDEIYRRNYYGNPRSSGVDHYDRVEADWKKLDLGPPDDMLYCFGDSQIMKHLAQYSSYELLVAYGKDHSPVPAHVFYQQQGRKLTAGAVGYYFTPPDRERILILTDQRWLVVGNEDRYTEASMRTKPLYDYIYGLGKEDEGKEEGCLPSVMLTQTKKQTKMRNLATYLGHAAKIAAIIHLINKYERHDDPIKIRPYAESELQQEFGSEAKWDEAVNVYVAIYEAQIEKGWWAPVDCTRAGISKNFFARGRGQLAASPWLICELILCGSPWTGSGWAGRGTLPSETERSKISVALQRAELGLEGTRRSSSGSSSGLKRPRSM